MKKIIGICCPLYNEEENIIDFYNAYSNIERQVKNKYEFNFLFLDNRSTDESFNILKKLSKQKKNVSVIRYSKNFGVMKSIYTGLLNVPSEWHSVAVFDCDLQDPPKILYQFLKEHEKGFELIYGKRIKRTEGYLQRILRSIYTFMSNILIKNKVDIESGAWFLDRKIINELKKRNYYVPYLPGLLGSFGYKHKKIEYSRLTRSKGDAKFNIISYFYYAIDSIIGSTLSPLRFSVILSVIFAVFSCISTIYFLLAKFILNIEFQEGIAAIIIILLFNFSLNFLILGILGEYIGRIFNKDEINNPAIIDEKIRV